MKRNHNDYEVIALIQEGNEHALEFMVSKYSRFIAKKIHKFNLAYDYDDLYQEGLILLYKSAMMFKEEYNKTFTRFFEMNFERYLISYIATLKRRQTLTQLHEKTIAENHHVLRENSVYYHLHLQEIKKILTPIEYEYYTMRALQNFSIEYIAKTKKCSEKVIYNAIHRAKAKIKAHFNE